MAVPVSSPDRRQLRRSLRRQIRLFCGPLRSKAETTVARSLIRHPWFCRARHVAIYLAFDGELDLTMFIRTATAQGRRLFAPQLSPSRQRMRFIHYGRTDTVGNHFGIDEPAAGRPIDPRSLDLVLLPLVGFDNTGTRIGMGGGHYDRLFSFLNTRHKWHHPKLLGVGFEFQRQQTLPREPWDVALHGAITERRRDFF